MTLLDKLEVPSVYPSWAKAISNCKMIVMAFKFFALRSDQAALIRYARFDGFRH